MCIIAYEYEKIVRIFTLQLEYLSLLMFFTLAIFIIQIIFDVPRIYNDVLNVLIAID
jgi:hypothetical protein